MPTKSNKSKYFGKKKMMADLLINPDFNGTVTELCGQVGVARSTFYDWMKDPDYLNYIQSLIDSFTDSELVSVWKALVSECKKGNVAAIKLFFELKGKYETKVSVEMNSLADILKQLDGEDSAE